MPNRENIAIDISNYTGMLGTKHIEWMRENAAFAIVRLSTEDGRDQRRIAAQQINELVQAGIPWQGYLWCYWQDDPVEHWIRATEMLPAGWPGYHGSGIWLDCEDTPHRPGAAFTWLMAYSHMLALEGFTPGIYTGTWWVRQNPAEFAGMRAGYLARMPAWWANYSHLPGCDVPQIEPWETLAMHQYASVNVGPVLLAYDLSYVCQLP